MAYTIILNEEEYAELKYLLREAMADHADVIKDLISDDSTKAEEFRAAVADENRRQVVRERILHMLTGGE